MRATDWNQVVAMLENGHEGSAVLAARKLSKRKRPASRGEFSKIIEAVYTIAINPVTYSTYSKARTLDIFAKSVMFGMNCREYGIIPEWVVSKAYLCGRTIRFAISNPEDLPVVFKFLTSLFVGYVDALKSVASLCALNAYLKKATEPGLSVVLRKGGETMELEGAEINEIDEVRVSYRKFVDGGATLCVVISEEARGKRTRDRLNEGRGSDDRKVKMHRVSP